MIKESTILGLQFSASLFMATDYFFDEGQRKAINAAIHKRVRPLQENVDADIREHLDYIIKQWAGLVVACGFLLAGWAGVHLLPMISQGLAPWAIAVLSLFFLFLFAGAMPRLTGLLVQVAVPLAMASSLRLITSFLLRCPKGTVFGIGFLLLLVTFACRYANLP